MYIENKLLKVFLKFLEKNTPNLKDLKGAQGSDNILLNCLLKKFLWAHVNFNLKSSLPSKISLYAFDAFNKKQLHRQIHTLCIVFETSGIRLRIMLHFYLCTSYLKGKAHSKNMLISDVRSDKMGKNAV